MTGMRLRHLELTPNFALRVAVQVRRIHITSRQIHTRLLLPSSVSPQHLTRLVTCRCCAALPFVSPTLLLAAVDQIGHAPTAITRQVHGSTSSISGRRADILGLPQEWAGANCVPLPVRNDRANTTSYYRFEEEVPTNILQARSVLLFLAAEAAHQGQREAAVPLQTLISRPGSCGPKYIWLHVVRPWIVYVRVPMCGLLPLAGPRRDCVGGGGGGAPPVLSVGG